MSNLAKALLVVATLAVAYMIYKKLKGRSKPTTPTSTNGPQIGSGDLGTTSSGSNEVDVNYGCESGSAYANTCTTINFTNPQSNLGCCGRQVHHFQVALNNYQAFGLVEDGKYGPATLQAHETIRSQQAIPPDLPGVNFSF